MAIKAVLDTRFFFALFKPDSRKQEDWCKIVISESEKAKKSSSQVYIASSITIAELCENMGRLVGKDVVRLRISSVKNSGIEFIPIDDEISELAGNMKLNSGELPMSDSVIAATACLLAGGRVFSDDPHFKKLKDVKLTWVD